MKSMVKLPTYVLDACALLRLAQAEPGMETVQNYLYAAQKGECTVLMHQINLGEVIYRIGKTRGWPVAERKRHEVGQLPIKIVLFDDALFWQAIQLKADHPIAYADAFAAALSIERKAILLSSDTEFDSLGAQLTRQTI